MFGAVALAGTLVLLLLLFRQQNATQDDLCRTVQGVYRLALIVAHDHHLPPPAPPPACQ